ncbi:tetratricopeptide repeat protein [bacterium]|nr:tetratricopeptide repeat protein [bacterium]
MAKITYNTLLIIIFLNTIILPIWSFDNIEQAISQAENENSPDSTLAHLYEQGYDKFKVSDPVKAIKYLKQLSEISSKRDDLNDKYHKYVRIGQLYHQLGMSHLALEFLFEASGYFLKVADETSLAWLYSDIGNVYFALQQYDVAGPYYQEGLKSMQNLQDKYGQSVMHNNIALCQLSTGKIDESFQNLEISLKLREEIGDIYAIYHSKFLLAKNYTLTGNHEKGFELYNEIWTQYTDDNILPEEAKMLRSSAGLALFGYYRHIGELDKAEKYLNDAIELIRNVGDTYTLGSALAQKAQFYVEQDKNQEALDIFTDIFDYAIQHGFTGNAHFYANWLVRLNFREKNMDEVEKYYDIYTNLTDSLITQRSSENLVKLHSIVQNHIKEVENYHLKEKQLYSQRLLIISIISLLIIILLIILNYLKDKRNLEKIRKLANASSEGIVVHDRGAIIDYNNQFKRMFRNPNKSLTISNLLDLSTEDDKEQIEKLLFSNEKTELETKLISAQHGLIDVKISSRPYIYHKKEVRVAVIQDTTKINQYISSIIKVQKELKILNATKDRLFSIIAHDLKNPFNAIIGFTNLMKDAWQDIPPEEMDEMISMINESSISAHTLLENLLDWARIQTDQFSFEPTAFALNHVIDEIMILLSASIKLKQIEVDVNCEDDLYIYADNRMLSTIIRNLLTNAIKFTHIKGIIKIYAGENDTSTKLTIEDNGIGMTQSYIDNIFNIDFVKSNSGTSDEKGTGLGLVLCKELIEYHQGTIDIESVLDTGSKITITFPKENIKPK